MLSGEITKPEDIPEGDMRRHMPRFSPENFENNIELVRELQKIAKQKGCTPAQLAISWVKHLYVFPRILFRLETSASQYQLLSPCLVQV